MIRVQTISGLDPNAREDPALHITISGRTDLLKLQALLNRSLNCAPDFGAEWFEFSDRLEQFLTHNNIR